MRKIFTFFIALIIAGLYTQDVNAQAITGFKEIKLGTHIKTLKSQIWPISMDSKTDKFIKWYSYQKPGSALFEHLTLIETTIKAKSDTINEIVVKFDPYDKEDIQSIFEKQYGKPSDKAKWTTPKATLTLTGNRAIFKLN